MQLDKLFSRKKILLDVYRLCFPIEEKIILSQT